MNRKTATILSLFLTCIAAGTTVPKWEPRDFAFTSDAEHGNPFMVRFAATIRAPDGRAVQGLGFYDGDRTWKVRVAPWAEGAWSLTTASDDPALAGRQVSFTCVANGNPEVHGPLRVDGDHPHWFVFADGTRRYVMGYEADWLWALDMTSPATPTLNRFLDKLKGHGFNYIVLNAYAHDTSWRKGRTSDNDYGPPPLYAWMGSNENPDHSRLNLAYWRHYDRMMTALLERGITAHLMLKVYNKSVNWPTPGSAEDDLYFKWIVARYAAFPNVVWDFSKEAFYEKDVSYKISRLRLIRENDPYRHLITIHDDNGYDRGTWDDLADFQADQNHGDGRHKTILDQRARGRWPVMNIEFGYEHGPKGPNDKTYGGAQSPEVVCQRAWELVTAGAYITYYYTYTAWDVLRPGDTPTGYGYFKILRDFWDSVEYWKMSPADHVVDKGYCLADAGREYVIYQPDAQPFTLTLGDVSGMFAAEWLHPFTGRRVRGELVAGGKHRLSPPPAFGTTPVVLHLRKPIYEEKDGKVVMQFESAPAVDEWILETTVPGYSGSGYYAWRGQDQFKQAGRGRLTYKFLVHNPGTYHLRFRSLHMHEDTSLENDVWTRMDGGEWKKTFATPNKQWTWMTKHDFGGYKPWASYVLGKGVHVLEFAGRSKNFSIDLIHLYRDGVPWKEDHTLPESAILASGNLTPWAEAGPERNVTLPQDRVVLTGAGEDADGRIAAWKWEKVAGPSVQMQDADSRRVTLSGLKSGHYTFRLEVTDTGGGTGYDEVKVTVFPASQVSVLDRVHDLVDGQVQFETEAAPAAGQWKIESETPGYSGAGYLVWRGDNYFDDPQTGPQIGYRIRVPEAGEYSFRLHNRHDHELGDQENDTWMRFDDGPWVKCYSNQGQRWTWETGFIDFDGFWHLDAGVHTLYLSPRSFGHKLDQIHVFRKGLVQKDTVNISE